MVGFEQVLNSQLRELNREMQTLNRLLGRILMEQRYQNAMFRKVYNVSVEDIDKRNEDFKEEWK